MKTLLPRCAWLTALLALGACTVMPTGPSVMVLPGGGKNFEQFRADDAHCRRYAYSQVDSVAASQSATDRAVGSAVVGTAIGALAGAALGGDHHGAAAGAGMGLMTGSSIGASKAQYSAYESQRRYDMAYVQCMYASGHHVPGYGGMSDRHSPDAPSYYYPGPRYYAPQR